MNTQLLISFLQVALDNNPSKILEDTLRQVSLDVELNDTVEITDFSNEFYSVRSINLIKQCFNFKVK